MSVKHHQEIIHLALDLRINEAVLRNPEVTGDQRAAVIAEQATIALKLAEEALSLHEELSVGKPPLTAWTLQQRRFLRRWFDTIRPLLVKCSYPGCERPHVVCWSCPMSGDGDERCAEHATFVGKEWRQSTQAALVNWLEEKL